MTHPATEWRPQAVAAVTEAETKLVYDLTESHEGRHEHEDLRGWALRRGIDRGNGNGRHRHHRSAEPGRVNPHVHDAPHAIP